MFLSRTFAKPQFARCFSGSAARFVAVGDKIPSATLFEGSPGNDVNLAEDAASGKAVVIGVPGAFSPACSASHVPGYLKKLREFNDKGYTSFYVVGVNDAFVMKAWGDSLLGHLTGTNQVRFLADPKGEFSEALDTLFDASKFFGNSRTKRFALLLEDGVVTKTFIEPDNVSVEVSGADAVLKEA
ncbi:CIC11C00000003990 [Sungouiella intermedia]|uniref:CIC11C00000003990 n=1 Tax=Sungouiella intermedia TaxID=45354 RepID=A0A1L0DC63_9ASCO|nr:CIC11C00000003990 [[Candida] intermedia]